MIKAKLIRRVTKRHVALVKAVGSYSIAAKNCGVDVSSMSRIVSAISKAAATISRLIMKAQAADAKATKLAKGRLGKDTRARSSKKRAA